MFEANTLWLQNTAEGKVLLTALLSMAPVGELRLGIPAGVAMGLPISTALIAGVLGNMVPVPFVILFIREIFKWMRARSKKLAALVDRVEKRAYSKLQNEKLVRWQEWGLLVFVAIPLPGTGAWTGALVAALMDLRLKNAVPVIFIGVVCAGLIMTAVTYGVAAIL